MKKFFTFLFILSMGIFVSNGQELLYEDFESDQMPPTGWSIDAHVNNWSTVTSSWAGSMFPEARFSWAPQFNDDSRLISPEVDLTGHTSVGIEFNQMVDHYGGAYTLGVATRSGGGNWNSIWEISPSSSIEAEVITLFVDNADVGEEDFQFCIYFSGNSYNINYWYLDNIKLFAPYGLDCAISQSLIPEYTPHGDYNVTGYVKNYGLDNVNSVELNYQLDDGDIHTQSFSGLDLGFADTYMFSFDDILPLSPGVPVLKIWLSDVNGGGLDNNPENDQLNKQLHIASNTVQRLPVFEEFTSSTCGPCATFNNNTLHPLLDANEGKYSLVKYQMDWPGSGDPYYTEEGGVRRAYYGVSAVPSLYTDGGPGATNQIAFDNAYNKPAMMSIDAAFDLNGTVITLAADIHTYVTYWDFTVHIAVVEKITTGNVGTNGETEFHNVMMKMMPDADGTTVSAIDGETVHLEESVDLANTFIEEYDDLEVVVFIQNNVTKEVFQSTIAGIGVGLDETITNNNLKIYPNPFSKHTNIEFNFLKQSKISAVIYDLSGQEVTVLADQIMDSGSHILQWNGTDNRGSKLNPGFYFVKLTTSENTVTKRLILTE